MESVDEQRSYLSEMLDMSNKQHVKVIEEFVQRVEQKNVQQPFSKAAISAPENMRVLPNKKMMDSQQPVQFHHNKEKQKSPQVAIKESILFNCLFLFTIMVINVTYKLLCFFNS